MNLVRTLATTTAMLIVAQTTSAQAFCDRPGKPSCIDMMALSREEVTLQLCRSDMERYQRRSSEYQDCLRTEFEDMSSERKKMIERFNNCAQNTYCY